MAGRRALGRRRLAGALSPFGAAELPPGLPVFFLAFLLGPVLAYGWNKLHDAETASDSVIERYGGEIERLLFRAMNDNSLVLVTLESRKVYIGWPIFSPGLRRETKEFRILPAVSGYRDEKTLELRLTTQYLDAYDQVRKEKIPGMEAADFETVLPLKDVVSANLFELGLDQRTFKMQAGP